MSSSRRRCMCRWRTLRNRSCRSRSSRGRAVSGSRIRSGFPEGSRSRHCRTRRCMKGCRPRTERGRAVPYSTAHRRRRLHIGTRRCCTDWGHRRPRTHRAARPRPAPSIPRLAATCFRLASGSPAPQASALLAASPAAGQEDGHGSEPGPRAAGWRRVCADAGDAKFYSDASCGRVTPYGECLESLDWRHWSC